MPSLYGQIVTTTAAATVTRRGLLRRTLLGAAGLGLVGLSAGCGAGGAEEDGRAADDAPVTGVTEIAVRDDEFEPAAIEVPAGTTVTWRWQGDHPHNVVGDGLESETQTDGTFAHTFDTPGRHDYECTLHGGMTGTVTVT